jgi:hypothetical protein
MNCVEEKLWDEIINICNLQLNCEILNLETHMFHLNLQELKQFIYINKKLPFEHNNNYEKKLVIFLNHNWDNEIVEQLKTENNGHFLSNFSCKNYTNKQGHETKKNWDSYFSELKHFITTNKRKPNNVNEKEKNLKEWIDYNKFRFKDWKHPFPFYNENENLIKIFGNFLEEYDKLN